MDAKQVWRAALGELQVSLSPANYETWLKDTQLVDVDGDRFRVAAPNGFAKDWLENRYRSLIAQTLARVVGYSVNVEFEVRELDLEAPVEVESQEEAARPDKPQGSRRAGPRRRSRGRGCQPQLALHLPHLHRRHRQPPRARGQPVGRGASR